MTALLYGILQSRPFQEALHLQPDDVEIKYQLGVAFMEVRDFNIAAQYFEEYITHNFTDEIAFFLLGKCYFDIGDYPAAFLALQ